MSPVNTVFVAQPPGQVYVNPFDSAALDPPFKQEGTDGVGGGALLAVQVTGGVLRPNATTVRDWNGFWRNPMTTWDQIARFTLGNNQSAGAWFSNLMIRAWDGANDGGQVDYCYLNFRNNQIYLGHFTNSVGPTDWASGGGNLASGDVIELSAVGTKYAAIYETAAGVRTQPVTPYTDAGATLPYTANGPTAHKHCGLRIGYNGGDSPWCSKVEFYDAPLWPVHMGLTKSGTQAYSTAGTWIAPTSWAVRTGYPHTVTSGNCGVQMLGRGTVTATVNRATSTSLTGQTRILKNGAVQETSGSAAGTAVAWTSQPVTVEAGDVISFEIMFTAAGTISAATYLQVQPTAYG